MIESTWRHIKAFLNPHNRMGDYIHHLADRMLAAGYRSDNVDEFTKFVGTVATTDWSATPPPIAVMSKGDLPSSHFTKQSGRSPQQISLWPERHHG
jgi:hypothetical protein